MPANPPENMPPITSYLYYEDVAALNWLERAFGFRERLRMPGAKILQEPKDHFYGDRTYGAEDPEGHHWYFTRHVRDVTLEEMKQSAQKWRSPAASQEAALPPSRSNIRFDGRRRTTSGP